MTGFKSRNKGKAGEREALMYFQGAMIEVENALDIEQSKRMSARLQRNLQQSIDGGDDLIGIPGHSVEVKNCATLALPSWWAQAERQAVARLVRPVLVWKVRGGWLARSHGVVHPGSDGVVCDMTFEAFLKSFKVYYQRYLLDRMPE